MAINTSSSAASAYQQSCASGLEEAQKGFAALAKTKAPFTVDTVIEPLNALWMTIDRTSNDAALYRNVHPDAEVRAVADACEQEISKLITDLGLSRPIYDAISGISLNGQDEVTKRYIKHLVRDFKRAGVDRSEETRATIRALKEELVKIGQEFNKNIREDIRSIKLASAKELEGLPQDYIEAHPPADDGTITLTTDYPDYIPYMTYAKNDDKRLAFYREFRKRGYPANSKVLDRLLQKRHKLASLLGYDNWAHYITEDKMIKTAKAARDFIEKINTVAAKRAAHDYDELLAKLKDLQPGAKSVGDWQKSFIEELVKREKYNIDSQTLRQYFPYAGVKEGIFDITAKMFNVTYRRADVDVWHKDVEAWDIVGSDDGKPIGRFFLDMHPRDDKYKHAAAFPMRSGIEGVQIPEATLVCNFPKTDAAAGEEGLMEHDQVETFFHEFGHLLHHIFGGKQRWLGVSGINTEWDFVEAPSQMLEEWAWDAGALKTFAKNKSGEVIPNNLIKAMRRARDFGKGLWVKHQMFYAAVSLNYYDKDPAGMDTTALMKELQERYSPFDYVDDTYFQYSFGHLDGYSAIYYTYMWSLVIAKDLFSVFEDQGLLNPEAAARYRKYVLEPGGSKDAAVLVRDFLGRDYNFNSFARWLAQK